MEISLIGSSARWIASLPRFAVRALGILLLLAALAGSRAAAQATSGVTGVVTDPSGAVVVGVDVTLSNSSIGFSATAKTNGVGAYEFLNVPPAEKYSLAFSKDGFQTLTLDKVTLNVGNKETRDAQLKVGDTKVSVEVTSAAGETLNTTDASLGTIIDGDRIQDLPGTLVNNAANYLLLAPGVTPGGAVTGTRSDQTNITLDGLDVNDQRGGFAFTTTVNTPLDAIQELKTTVGGDDATYGHSSGGQLELVTKSGTNAFHGQAFEFNRVTAYAANDYFNNLQGIPNPKLIRNQFGGDVGGPILKNKLFFFFSYNGLRETQNQQILDTVPQPWVLQGQLAYVNNLGNTVMTPLSGANSLTALDPQGKGADQDLLAFMTARGYAGTSAIPAPNNTSVGDGINTSGYFFVAPVHSHDNTYIAKIDYQATKNHRLFVRGTWDRSSDDGFGGVNVQIFPNDPDPDASFIDHSRSWVGGDTWTITPNMTNQASFGETNQVNAFSINYEPTFPDSIGFDDPFVGNIFSSPFQGLNEQFPIVPVYQGRDTLNWSRGKHTFQFGGVISPIIFKSGNLTDTNSFDMGIGGDLTGLGPTTGCTNPTYPGCLPSDFDPNGAVDGNANEFGRVFTAVLGRLEGVTSGYNYDKAGNALPQGQVATRDYHSTQYEFFAQDIWNIRSDLTLTYGVRWQFHDPLSEVNGFEAVPNLGPKDIFTPRVQQAAQGIAGPNTVPFVTYGLGGNANNKPGYYKPAYNDFAPRLGLAYSPSATQGLLGKLLGNRQSSIRAGFGVDYDNNLIGQGFELDETSFMFSNTTFTNNANLATDPRFACPAPCSFTNLSSEIRGVQPIPAGGTTPRPTFTPNVDSNNFPVGFFEAGFGQGAMFNFDPNFRTPYSMHFSFGIQRELPGDWLVEADYVGKLGRKLTALGDPAQTLNFVNTNGAGGATTGQSLYDAFGKIESAIQLGNPVLDQPWFENEVTAALQQINPGFTCASQFGQSCTQQALSDTFGGFYFFDGDVSSTIESLADDLSQSGGNPEQGLLRPNVGLLAQDGAAGYIGNYSASSYNALVIRVNHRISHDLTMEMNYAYSHSIDNDSGVQNGLISFSGSEICDLRNLRVCRGSSDFDHRHLLSANFEYGLPIGRGKWIGGNSSKLLNEAIGGWRISGIAQAYTGSPYKIDSGAFTIDFTQTQPGVFTGTRSDLASSVHQVPSGTPGVPNTVQYFSNVTNAFKAFTFPIAGGPGNRNIFTGPGFWNVDLALFKDFTMPWSDNQKLQFRAEGINVFNHTNFSNLGGGCPNGSNCLYNPSTFGNITSDVNGPRNLQLALKYSF